MAADWHNVQVLGENKCQRYIMRMSEEEREGVIMAALREKNDLSHQIDTVAQSSTESDADCDWQTLQLLDEDGCHADLKRMSEKEKLYIIFAALQDKNRLAMSGDLVEQPPAEMEGTLGHEAAQGSSSPTERAKQDLRPKVEVEPAERTTTTTWEIDDAGDVPRRIAAEKRKRVSVNSKSDKRTKKEPLLGVQQATRSAEQTHIVRLDEVLVKKETYDAGPRRSKRIASLTQRKPIDFTEKSEEEEENDDDDDDDQQFASQSNKEQASKQEEMISREQERPQYLRANDLPMVLWISDGSGGGAWKDIDDLNERVRRHLEKAWKSRYDDGKARKGEVWHDIAKHPEGLYDSRYCLGWLIKGTERVVFPTFDKYGGNHKHSACDWCVAGGKPCAHFVAHEGIPKIGFVPLPDQQRHGDSWQGLDYWITRRPRKVSRDGKTYAYEGQWTKKRRRVKEP